MMKGSVQTVLLITCMVILSGCVAELPQSVSNKTVAHDDGMVLLSVNQHWEDFYDLKTTFVYNDQRQIIMSISSDPSDDCSCLEVYHLRYDDEGRLVEKRGGPYAGYSLDDLDRQYDESGNLARESGYDEELRYKVEYIYDVKKRVAQENWMYGEDPDEQWSKEYLHTYSNRSDGMLEDQRQWFKNGELVGENTNLYDASGRLMQGYDDEWDTLIQYKYLKDKYFNLYTESKNQYGKSKVAENRKQETDMYAEILDTAGKTIERIRILGSPRLKYNSDGYLVKAQTDQGYAEFIYGMVH